MIPVTTAKGKRIALFGLGGSGLSTARALIAGGADVTCWDDNPGTVEKAEADGMPVGDLHALDWASVDSLVLAPGVPLTHPKPHWSVDLAHAAKTEVIGDVELFCRERRALASKSPFVAITGTNGKSTTTALIGHLLQSAGRTVSVGGNIGTAVLGLEPFGENRAYVLELSSYQIDLTPTLDPTVGILLNITPDHLDRHGTLKHYAEVKARIAEMAETTVIAIDDDWTCGVADQAEADGKRIVRVSASQTLEIGVYMHGSTVVSASGSAEAAVADLAGIGSLRGAHNAQNAVAAVAAALAVGLEPAEIAEGLGTFPGLAHRMEIIGRVGEVLFVNDSKATNAEAASRSLASFKSIYWIAGGRAKSGGIESLREHFPKVRRAYLIGEAAGEFAASLAGQVPNEDSGDLATAVAAAARAAANDRAPEPVVLLAPACASFDQFADFEARGNAFRKLVAGLDGVVLNAREAA